MRDTQSLMFRAMFLLLKYNMLVLRIEPRSLACQAGVLTTTLVHRTSGDHPNVSWWRSHTNASGLIATSYIVPNHITKLLPSFRQILPFCPQGRIPQQKVIETKDPSAAEAPLCREAVTTEITFSITSVLQPLDLPLSLSREKNSGRC